MTTIPRAGVYIGRFCPLHHGHMKIIDEMIKHHGIDKCLILIGSCNADISFRVLFKHSDRRRWIKRIYPDLKQLGLPDYPNDDTAWLTQVEDIVSLVFGKECEPTFYGGCQEDIEIFYDAGHHVKIIDRMEYPVSATNVRQLLLMNEDINTLVDTRISSEVIDVFRKRMKELDKLR
jgi:nicotinamide mononucleotide adenylyltransferase